MFVTMLFELAIVSQLVLFQRTAIYKHTLLNAQVVAISLTHITRPGHTNHPIGVFGSRLIELFSVSALSPHINTHYLLCVYGEA